jgi:signal transduction histidine kinase
MAINMRFKTILFIWLLISTLTFLIFLMGNTLHQSRTILEDQLRLHSQNQTNRFEAGFRTYLNGVEENLLTLRANHQLIESFYHGDASNFRQALSDWEENFENARYDFVAVSFEDDAKCFLFKGYFTGLESLSCADLFNGSSQPGQHGWQALEHEALHLALFSTELTLKHSGQVIGRLMGGVKLTDNQFLLDKLVSADTDTVKTIEIVHEGTSLSTLQLLAETSPSWQRNLLRPKESPPILSSGDTPLGPEFRLRVRADDRSLQALHGKLLTIFAYGSLLALLAALFIALLLSRALDRQLQSLITFARKAHSEKRTRWRKTHIADFNAIGSEFAQIMQDLQEKEETLARTNAELEHSNGDKRRILHHLIRSQEKERRRLANELHDDLGQMLAAARVNVTLLQGELTRQQLPTDTADTTLGIINAMYDTVYNRIVSLRPFEMNDFGLDISLPRMPVIAQLERMDYAVLLEISQSAPLTEEAMTNLYRITQEALTNVLKHAHGTYVLVQLRDACDGVHLRIEDNGAGFPQRPRPDDTGSRMGFGLMSIQERVESLHGTLTIGTGEEGGVCIDVTIPARHAYTPAHSTSSKGR